MRDSFAGLLHSIVRCESYGEYRASAVTIGSSELSCLKPDGSPTLFKKENVPLKIKNIVDSKNVTFSCGSGYPNPNPGIDVFRYDENDRLPYNRDHYSIFYDPINHRNFDRWIYTAGIPATSTNLEVIKTWAFIIKAPIDPKNHHLTYEAAFEIYESITK